MIELMSRAPSIGFRIAVSGRVGSSMHIWDDRVATASVIIPRLGTRKIYYPDGLVEDLIIGTL